MSDQPSSSEPTTSTSGREIEEPTHESDEEEFVPNPNYGRDVEEPTYSDSEEERLKIHTEWYREREMDKLIEQLDQNRAKKRELETETIFLGVFKKSVPTLEYDAVRIEMDMKKRKLTAPGVVTEFRKLSKEMKAQMLTRPFVRRNLVGALYAQCGTDQNKTMNMIKELTGKKKSPVAMKEIEYCIRRFSAREDANRSIHIDVLLKEEEILKTRDDPRFVDKFEKSLAPNTEIDSVDIRVKPKHLDVTFLEIKIGKTYKSQLFQPDEYDGDDDDDQTITAMTEVANFLDVCQENEAKIKELKLAIGGCEMSGAFLLDFMKFHCVSELTFETFELQHCGAKVSDSLNACKNIKCTNLKITHGTFMQDDTKTIFEAMKNCTLDVKSWLITSTEPIYDTFITWGLEAVDPCFDITVGFSEKTGQNCILFEKTDGTEDGNPKQCKWKSFD